jgi:hypothetical protein
MGFVMPTYSTLPKPPEAELRSDAWFILADAKDLKVPPRGLAGTTVSSDSLRFALNPS